MGCLNCSSGAISPPNPGALGPCHVCTCEGHPGPGAAVLHRLELPSQPLQRSELQGFLSGAPS